jgi:hypothetical protein
MVRGTIFGILKYVEDPGKNLKKYMYLECA